MRGIPEEGPKPDVSARDRLASWFRVSKVLLSFLLLFLAGSIAIPVLALNHQPEEPDTAQTTCLGAGYTISVVWSDSSQTRAQWQDRNYSDISLSSLHKELVDRIRSLHIFSGIVDRSDDPHDFDLVINIERLQRRPISSPDDLWLESSFALVWRTYRQSLWTGRYGIPLEAREVAFPNTSPPALHLLMVRAAASKLAFRMGNDLKRFLSGDGLAKLAETRSAPCAALTVLRLRDGDISLADQNALLQVLSGSPCFAVVQDADGAAHDPGLTVNLSPDLPALRILVTEASDTLRTIYSGSWSAGNDEGRGAILQEALKEIVRYHHRNGECAHYRYALSHRRSLLGSGN